MSAAEVEETIAILFSPKDCETLDAVARESDDVPSRHSALLDALSSSEIYVDAEKVMAAGSTGSTDFLAEKGMVRATPTAQAPEPGVIMRRGRDAIAARASERQNVQTNKCQYIVSVPERGGPVQFCQTDGKPTPSIPGKSYCLAHANICYVGFRCQ
jgi:hypothetical protein